MVKETLYFSFESMWGELFAICFIFFVIIGLSLTFNEDAACYCGFYHRTKMHAVKLNTHPLAYRLSFKTNKQGDYIRVYGKQNKLLHEGPVQAKDLKGKSNYSFELKKDPSENSSTTFERIELYRGGILRAVAKV